MNSFLMKVQKKETKNLIMKNTLININQLKKNKNNMKNMSNMFKNMLVKNCLLKNQKKSLIKN